MQLERSIGGLTCREVLAKLDAFVDDALDPITRDAVIAHVGGCGRCERFGSAYAGVVRHIRAIAHDETAPPASVLERLRARLSHVDEG
jgi:hypothetical protein